MDLSSSTSWSADDLKAIKAAVAAREAAAKKEHDKAAADSVEDLEEDEQAMQQG